MPDPNKELIRKVQAESLERTFTVNREAINEEARTVELAFSSETPVSRWFGNEVLDHDQKSVRLGRLRDGAAVLVGHNTADQVGVVEDVSIGMDRRGRVLARFGKSERASEIFNDIKDGIRRHVSVGYRIFEAFVEKRGEDGEPDVVRVTDWEPFEVSIVPVPADPSVGVGRSAEQIIKNDFIIRGATMPGQTKPEETNTPEQERSLKENSGSTVTVESNARDARNQERTRIREIEAAGAKFNQTELARKYVDEERSVEEFREALLRTIPESKGQPVTSLDLSTNERKQYSLMKAIRAHVKNDWKDAGFELECSREIAERLKRDPNGFFVPFDIQNRANGTGTLASGGALVGTDHLASEFIDVLRPQTVIGRLGATYISGLVGDVDIPRLDAEGNFYWLAEDGDVSDDDFVFGNVPMSPKTVAGGVPMTRRLLKQSSPSVEALVLNSLVRGSAVAIDKAALQGTGSDQPTGIYGTSGVNVQTVANANGVPTHAELVGFETQVDTDDALEGTLAYVSTAAIRGALKTTPKDAGSGIMLLENGEANDYQFLRSNNLSAGRTIFGNFEDVIVGMWGVLDIEPDKAAKAAAGGLIIRVFQDVDVAVRRPSSFCING